MVLHQRPRRTQTGFRWRHHLVTPSMLRDLARRREHERMARQGQAHHPPCRRTESPSPCLRSCGQDSHANPCVSLGARTEVIAKPSPVAIATLRAYHEESTRTPHYHDCKWRRVYPCHTTHPGHSRCRRGMLWTLARCQHSQESRCFRIKTRNTFHARPHDSEAIRETHG